MNEWSEVIVGIEFNGTTSCIRPTSNNKKCRRLVIRRISQPHGVTGVLLLYTPESYPSLYSISHYALTSEVLLLEIYVREADSRYNL